MRDLDLCEYIDDPATIYTATMVTARKAHDCDECGGEIVPGERYERAKGMNAPGEWWHARTCAACCRGPLAFVERNCGTGRYHGGLFEHLCNVISEGALRSVFAEGMVLRWIDEARVRRNADWRWP